MMAAIEQNFELSDIDKLVLGRLFTQFRLILANAITLLAQCLISGDISQKKFEVIRESEDKFLLALFPELKDIRIPRLEEIRKKLAGEKPFVIRGVQGKRRL